MRRRFPVIALPTASFSSPTASRTCALMAASAFAGTLVPGGCGPAMTRPQVSQADLVKLRTKGDEEPVAAGPKLLGRLRELTKTEYDRSAAEGKEPPVSEILIVS